MGVEAAGALDCVGAAGFAKKLLEETGGFVLVGGDVIAEVVGAEFIISKKFGLEAAAAGAMTGAETFGRGAGAGAEAD